MQHILDRLITFDLVAQSSDTGSDTASGEEVIQTDITCDNGGAVCDVVLDVTGSEALANATSVLGTFLKIGLIVLVALLVNRLARRAIRSRTTGIEAPDHSDGTALVSAKTAERAEERAGAIGTVLNSITTAIVAVVAALMILSELGINVAPIIASAGIAGVALGFGAQSLVEDFLAGLSMVVEDQFGVGDRVDLGDGAVGTVERITLRTTSVRDGNGALWHVPNGQIDRTVNLSQEWSQAVLDIGVAYDADLQRAEESIVRAARELEEDDEWSDRVVGEPEVLGIQELGADAVILRVRTRTVPGGQAAVERELRARVKRALDAAGIEMPYPTRTLYLRETSPAAGG